MSERKVELVHRCNICENNCHINCWEDCCKPDFMEKPKMNETKKNELWNRG